MRKYSRNFIEYNGSKISYIVSDLHANNNLICFPQGMHDADFVANKYDQIFANNLNIYIFDQPNTGESPSLGRMGSPEMMSNFVIQLFGYADITAENTILFGKSFSGSYIEAVLKNNDNLKGAIIVAGPRMLSRMQSKIVLHFFNFGSRVKFVRILFYKILKLIDKFTGVKRSYYNWEHEDIWYLVKNIICFRLNMQEIEILYKTPVMLIFNAKDELISNKVEKEIMSSFVNSEIVRLDTQGHWKESDMELQYIKAFLETCV